MKKIYTEMAVTAALTGMMPLAVADDNAMADEILSLLSTPSTTVKVDSPEGEPAPLPEQAAEETPAAEEPAAETPAKEEPAAETPAEEPAAETPAKEEPAAETPAEEPAAEPTPEPAAEPEEVKPEPAEEPAAEDGGETKPEPQAEDEGGETKPEIAEEDEGGEIKPLPTAEKNEFGLSDRLLSRPGVALHAEPTDESKSKNYLPSYSILTVVGQKDDWYQVAKSENGSPIGWLKADEIIAWKHQLVMQFSNPAGRERALFFATRDEAAKVVAMGDEERDAYLAPVRKAIEEKTELEDSKVVACEPDGLALMKNNTYLLPVVAFDQETVMLGDEEAQLIRVSAATENLSNDGDLQDTKGMTADVVFVMDLSRSMGPIKEDVLNSIRSIVKAIETNPELKPGMVQFGFCGYRDDVKACKGIEFVSKNYTPEGTLTAPEFEKVLEKVAVTRVDSIDYAEDVLAGVREAIETTQWREDSARIIVLIGDAPGREPGQTDPHSRSSRRPVGTAAGEGVKELSGRAQEKSISMATAYLNVPRYEEHLPIAREQFEGLASRSEDRLATTVIDVKTPGAFTKFSQDFVPMLVLQVKQAAEGKSEIKAKTEGQALATALFASARVQWLASKHSIGATPEMDGWVIDRDLKDPVLKPMSACVLLNREQLDNLRTLLSAVVEAGEQYKLTASSLLQTMQKVLVASAKDPELLKDARTLKDSRFVPSFLKELPYHSEVMNIGDDDWRAMNVEGQSQILLTAKNKLKLYQDIYADADSWIKLDPSADNSEEVTPIPLDQLP